MNNIKKNETYDVEILDLGNNGEGVGKIDGFTIFVEGGIPKDLLIVKIVKVNKNFGFGKIMEIIKPSEYRKTPDCKYFPRCGGCQLQHMDYDAQVDFKSKKVIDCLNRIGNIKDLPELEVFKAAKVYNYRNKAIFPVAKGLDSNVNVGFYAQRSHNLIDIHSCMLQDDINEKIISIFKEFVSTNNISVYDEKTNKGNLRALMTRVAFSKNKIMVVVVSKTDKIKNLNVLVSNFKKLPEVDSVILNINNDKTNVVLGNKNIPLFGENFILDEINDLKFNISPNSFYQVNPSQTKILYEHALKYADVSENDTVLDIYCGIGTISLLFAKKAKSVIGVEVIDHAVLNAQNNALLNDVHNAEFFCGLAEDVVPKIFEEKNVNPDIVVVDPPRKGCEQAVLDTICKMNPKKVVYISCDPATLARDLKFLVEFGYSLKNLSFVDQFPNTKHVECVVLMSKVEK